MRKRRKDKTEDPMVGQAVTGKNPSPYEEMPNHWLMIDYIAKRREQDAVYFERAMREILAARGITGSDAAAPLALLNKAVFHFGHTPIDADTVLDMSEKYRAGETKVDSRSFVIGAAWAQFEMNKRAYVIDKIDVTLGDLSEFIRTFLSENKNE